MKLIPAANDAIPHVLVQDAAGAQVWEPFSWRVVRQFDGVALHLEELLVWGDGSVLATSFEGPVLARPDEPFRPLPGFPHGNEGKVTVSRWGLVWLEAGAPIDDRTLQSAPFDGFALGRIRSYGKQPFFVKYCRDSDTFGFRTSDDASSGPSIGMLDLASGVVTRTSVTSAHYVHCRPGEVGGLAIDVRNAMSAHCDRSGCRTLFTPPSRGGLNYHQLGLVDGALLMIASGPGPHQVVTQRTGAAPRSLRIAGDTYFQGAQLVMTHEGALVTYSLGTVLAFDHQGALIPIDLRWMNNAL